MAGRWRQFGWWLALVAAGTCSLAPSPRMLSMQLPAGPGQTPGFPIDRNLDRGLDRGRPEDDVPFGNRELQARQMKRMREEHQKQVFADTARLLQLATTLKEEADKGTKPSPGTLKDVDEIAKLAKRLSERIKNQ